MGIVRRAPVTAIAAALLLVLGVAGTAASLAGVGPVAAMAGPDLVVTPDDQTTIRGTDVTYQVTVPDDAGRVTLSLKGLPARASASFDPAVVPAGGTARLRVKVPTTVEAADYTFVVRGKAAGGQVVRHDVGLNVKPRPTREFGITGRVSGPLQPGVSRRISVVLTNPYRQRFRVEALKVAVVATSNPGCGPENFTVRQYAGPLPLELARRSSRSLRDLGVPISQWPLLRLRNLPVNQDACKGVTLTIDYAGEGKRA